MAALLAGARLVLQKGTRFLPAYAVRPVAFRCFSSTSRCLTTAVQDEGTADVDPVYLRYKTRPQPDDWSLENFETKLQKTRRVGRRRFISTFEEVCKAGILSGSQGSFLLQHCGSSMAEVPPPERTEIAQTVWNKLQELGITITVNHYNSLLKVFIENEHKFSPTEFLANMEAAQVNPNQVTYEGLIAAYCNEGDLQGASTILGFMKSNNLPITEQVFVSLITGHARSGDMESAKNILSVMNEAGVEHGKNTYTALLSAYAEKGDMESIKQTLEECNTPLTDMVFLKVIQSLAKAGHGQLVPDLFQYMLSCKGYKGYTQEVISLCLMLLTQGCEDTALTVAKKFIPIRSNMDYEFTKHPGSFFIRHLVSLNRPVDILKKYAPELVESKLHTSPLQFALLCALESGKQDLAFDIMRTMKNEGIPVRHHYIWPLLATHSNNNNVQGAFQVLKDAHKLGMQLDLVTFHMYVVGMFKEVTSVESILQEINFEDGFNSLYLSALKDSLSHRNYKRVYTSLLKDVPFKKDRGFIQYFMGSIMLSNDMEMMAKITKLLYVDSPGLRTTFSHTESVGYFLYGLIDKMSDSTLKAKEEHLKQYFHHLKEMGVMVKDNINGILMKLQMFNDVTIIEEFKALIPETHKGQKIFQLEDKLETRQNQNLPSSHTLNVLLNELIATKNLEKTLELLSKNNSDFTFPMYMKVLGLCCDMNNPKEALKVKEEADQKGFTELPSLFKYTNLIKVLALNGLMEDAINVLKEMQEKKICVLEHSNKSLIPILNNLARKGDVENVNRLLENILMLGLAKPSSRFCSPLVWVHLNRNDLSAALDAFITCYEKYKTCTLEYDLLFHLVENEETDLLKKAVDFIGTTIGEMVLLVDLLFVFIECKKYEEAQKIVETPGLRSMPRKESWILERLHKANKVEQLEKTLDITRNLYDCNRQEMYFHLLSLYEKNKDWTKAAPLWHRMKEERLPIQANTAKLFIKIFEKNGRDIYAHIPNFGKGSDAHERSMQIINLCKKGNVEDAYSLFLESNTNQVALSKTAYTRLIHVLLQDEKSSEALEVEAVCKSHNNDYSMTNVTYNLLLEEQVRQNSLKDAVGTFEKMLEFGMMPSRLEINKLTQALAMNGDLESLEKLETASVNGSVALHKIDKQFFNCKLMAHFLNSNSEEAISMIEETCTKNPHGSIALLIAMLVKNNMGEELEKVSIVVERLANQFSIFRQVTDLFFHYVKSEQLEEAKQLIQRCNGILEQKQYISFNIRVHVLQRQTKYVYQLLDVLPDPYYKLFGYNFLLKYLIITQKLDDAVSLYEKMKAERIKPNEDKLNLLEVHLRDAGMPVPFSKPQVSVQSSKEVQSSTDHRSPSEEKH